MERRFTLLDMMIVVAATAAGFGLMRPITANSLDHGATVNCGLAWSIVVRISWVILAIIPLLASWSLGLVILRLRQPRPSLRRLLRQPGFVASISVAFGSAISLLLVIACLLKYKRNEIVDSLFFVTYPVGYTVATGWMLLLLSSKWRNEKSWIDRAGRVLGVCWICVLFAFMVALIDG